MDSDSQGEEKKQLKKPIEAGVVPRIPKQQTGLSETSSTVSRTSGFYSIQNPKRQERVDSKNLIAISRSEKYELDIEEKNSWKEKKTKKRKVTGSYQFVKGHSKKKLHSEKVVLKEDVVLPRPVPRKGIRQVIRKIIGFPLADSEPKEIETGLDGKSDAIWYGDKPEGDKYWTVYTNDAVKEDTSVWTLVLVCIILSAIVGGVLWLILK